MVVDAVEAAVRSIDKPDSESISNMFDKIVLRFWQDGQFSDSSLSFAEVETIKGNVLHTYQGIMHQRVKYPDVDALKQELGKARRISDKSDTT